MLRDETLWACIAASIPMAADFQNTHKWGYLRAFPHAITFKYKSLSELEIHPSSSGFLLKFTTQFKF